MSKKKIVLFQPYLRKHILDFGKALKNFEFVVEANKFSSTKNFYKSSMSSPEREFSRSKIGWINKLRRTLGILNLRPKFTYKGDILFTYGCLLLTNKPYCTYIENGAALFNYDPVILRNPVAKFFFSIAIKLPQCKKLIFMSETAKKSFLATGNFSKSTESMIENKSIQIYPYTNAPENILPKKFTGAIKLLFTGIYYVKGGRELVNAFERIQSKHQNISLTIVTPLHMLLSEDRKKIDSIPNITLLDATFSPEEMTKLYRTHDIFMFPTFRDTFGLVLIEAISFGMPIIATNQYAVTEMAIPEYNAIILKDHPLLDYNSVTKEMYGKLYDAKTFYDTLFHIEKTGGMLPVENFLIQSIESFIKDPSLLTKYSNNSLELYNRKFHKDLIAQKIESVFTKALS